MSTNFAKQSIQKKILLGLSLVAIASSALLNATSATATARDVNAGPIFNNNDAKVKCPALAAAVGGKWNGQWRTTVAGKFSFCSIDTLPRNRRSPRPRL